ncbi:glycosyltransferase family 2 protein [Pontibacter sp. MBLB2868]|uniref:glycosyltransferase family 2 protein n=1 Tax=Pontibacter sp. MBLB2868 TaxID=3451555 RepID=UPI003F751B81
MEVDKDLMQPMVSILMTAYNRESYIREAIESVLKSSYMNWELIITDDCSSDRTLEIAKEYERIDSRITVYKNEKNLGDYPNRNRSASYAKGDFLTYLDSDDLLHKDSLVKSITAFSLNKKAQFGVFSPEGQSEPFALDPESALKKHFFIKSFLQIGPGGVIIKRKYFEYLKGYPTKYGPANDGYFNLKAASEAYVLVFPFAISYYRRHEGQEVNNKYAYLHNTYCYLRDALDELNLHLNQKDIRYLHKKNKRRFIVNVFAYYAKSNDINRSKQSLLSANFSLRDAFEGIFHF